MENIFQKADKKAVLFIDTLKSDIAMLTIKSVQIPQNLNGKIKHSKEQRVLQDS